MFKGYGCLVFIIPIVMIAVLSTFIAEDTAGKLGCFISGITLYYIGTNLRYNKFDHTFFEGPMDFWGILLIIGSIIYTLFNL